MHVPTAENDNQGSMRCFVSRSGRSYQQRCYPGQICHYQDNGLRLLIQFLVFVTFARLSFEGRVEAGREWGARTSTTSLSESWET